ncbi:condensation domain-containing protein [Symbioplanes lichenis]|uniref:condensation domain-containing protein n=1 Tax=Symbioplanes lichenis TaxID=1629072 RepID=UPI002739C03A|nr:condensation domain-containing protein [Actinoplanes lichenis]
MSASFLTYSQLSAWRSIEPFPVDQHTPLFVTKVWPLPAELTVRHVEDAFTRLAQLHGALRTRFELQHEDEPRQRVEADAVVPHEIHELIATDDTEAPLSMPDTFATRPFDLEREPAWRVCIVTRDGRPQSVVVCCHHMIADAWAMRVLREDLFTILAGAIPPDAPEPGELAEVQRSTAWARRHEATMRHWVTAIRSGVDPGVPEDDEPRPRLWASLESVTALDAARVLAEATRTSVHSVVLTAFAEVVARQSGRQRFRVGLLAGNRSQARWRRLVCPMDQLTPMVYARQPDRPITETIQHVHRAALSAYSHASFDVDELAAELEEFGFDAVDGGMDVFFNFIPVEPAALPGTGPFRATDAEPWRLTVSDQGRNNGVPTFLKVSAGAYLLLRLQESRAGSTAASMEQHLMAVQELLRAEASLIR